MEFRRASVAVIAVSGLWLAGCAHAPPSAPLRIDGSSPAALQASWDRMHRSLTREQQAQLDVAVLPIAFGPYKSFTNVPPALLAGVGPKDIRSQIDGMTFEEILALARSEPVKVGLPGRP
jgi:hypothetical protein